ncbi:SPOR domain-containing protein [Pedobacter sp. SYSU D00535]|uniref:SPOR domain-containing protein n=1 Tax=Pedobacter sp. SYSU D00535 TaxID=2810308 RepID=UPI001A958AB9|nr:SPOR domain-containing protein [Pedobacter sp. SYSU D00535]
MDVGLFISELLKEQNEVSLPGIGTFYRKKKSAFFDKSKGLFYPPSFELGFKEDAGSVLSEGLIEHIRSAKNISAASARYFAEKYTDSLQYALRTTGAASLNSVGVLQKAEHGLSFKATEASGSLSSFALPPVKEIKTSFFTSDRRQPLPAELPAEVVDTEAVHKKRRVWPAVLLAGLFVIAATITGIYFYNQELFNSLVKQVESRNPRKTVTPVAKPQPKTTADSIAMADSIIENTLKQEGFVVEQPRDTVNINTKTTTTVDSTRKAVTRYEIISASFNRRSEADNYVKIMRKRGIDASVIEDDKKPKFKVSIGSFTNNDAAQKEKRRIHEEINKEAWILIIKNNNNNK